MFRGFMVCLMLLVPRMCTGGPGQFSYLETVHEWQNDSLKGCDELMDVILPGLFCDSWESGCLGGCNGPKSAYVFGPTAYSPLWGTQRNMYVIVGYGTIRDGLVPAKQHFLLSTYTQDPVQGEVPGAYVPRGGISFDLRIRDFLFDNGSFYDGLDLSRLSLAWNHLVDVDAGEYYTGGGGCDSYYEGCNGWWRRLHASAILARPEIATFDGEVSASASTPPQKYFEWEAVSFAMYLAFEHPDGDAVAADFGIGQYVTEWRHCTPEPIIEFMEWSTPILGHGGVPTQSSSWGAIKARY